MQTSTTQSIKSETNQASDASNKASDALKGATNQASKVSQTMQNAVVPSIVVPSIKEKGSGVLSYLSSSVSSLNDALASAIGPYINVNALLKRLGFTDNDIKDFRGLNPSIVKEMIISVAYKNKVNLGIVVASLAPFVGEYALAAKNFYATNMEMIEQFKKEVRSRIHAVVPKKMPQLQGPQLQVPQLQGPQLQVPQLGGKRAKRTLSTLKRCDKSKKMFFNTNKCKIRRTKHKRPRKY